MRHSGRLTKVTKEGPESDGRGSIMGYFTLEVGSEKSFMRFYIYHAQPDGLKVLPAWLGALAGFSSANNRGLFAVWQSLDNDMLALARNQPQRGRLHHSHQQKALPPTMTEYDRDTYRPSQIAVEWSVWRKSEHTNSLLNFLVWFLFTAIQRYPADYTTHALRVGQ